jgi:hypothetical protein
MPSVQTLGPICTLVSAASTAVPIGSGNPPQAYLLQNQGTVTVYLGNSVNVLVSAAVQIAAGASFNPDKHQAPRTDLQVYGLDNYYVSTRTSTAAILAVLYHEILNR